jgi:hypothetical protein
MLNRNPCEKETHDEILWDSLISRFSYITVDYVLIIMELVVVARGFFFLLYCGIQTAAVMWRRMRCGRMTNPNGAGKWICQQYSLSSAVVIFVRNAYLQSFLKPNFVY